MEHTEALVLGNRLIARGNPGYEQRMMKFRQSEHTVDAVFEALANTGRLPENWGIIKSPKNPALVAPFRLITRRASGAT